MEKREEGRKEGRGNGRKRKRKEGRGNGRKERKKGRKERKKEYYLLKSPRQPRPIVPVPRPPRGTPMVGPPLSALKGSITELLPLAFSFLVCLHSLYPSPKF